jgi:hypothetical protein
MRWRRFECFWPIEQASADKFTRASRACSGASQYPRRLPWALLSCPFGAKAPQISRAVPHSRNKSRSGGNPRPVFPLCPKGARQQSPRRQPWVQSKKPPPPCMGGTKLVTCPTRACYPYAPGNKVVRSTLSSRPGVTAGVRSETAGATSSRSPPRQFCRTFWNCLGSGR